MRLGDGLAAVEHPGRGRCRSEFLRSIRGKRSLSLAGGSARERFTLPKISAQKLGLRDRSSRDVQNRVAKTPARADAEFGEHFAQVILGRARADEQLRADLGVGAPLGREARDQHFLRGRTSRDSMTRLRTVSPVASSSPRARSANASAPMRPNLSYAMRSYSRASTRRFWRRSHSPYTKCARGLPDPCFPAQDERPAPARLAHRSAADRGNRTRAGGRGVQFDGAD